MRTPLPVLANEPLPVITWFQVTALPWLKVRSAPLESVTPLVLPIEAPFPPMPTESVPPVTAVSARIGVRGRHDERARPSLGQPTRAADGTRCGQTHRPRALGKDAAAGIHGHAAVGRKARGVQQRAAGAECQSARCELPRLLSAPMLAVPPLMVVPPL